MVRGNARILAGNAQILAGNAQILAGNATILAGNAQILALNAAYRPMFYFDMSLNIENSKYASIFMIKTFFIGFKIGINYLNKGYIAK